MGAAHTGGFPTCLAPSPLKWHTCSQVLGRGAPGSGYVEARRARRRGRGPREGEAGDEADPNLRNHQPGANPELQSGQEEGQESEQCCKHGVVL